MQQSLTASCFRSNLAMRVLYGRLLVKYAKEALACLDGTPLNLLVWRRKASSVVIASRQRLLDYSGGDLAPGQIFEEAALRELWKETGLTQVALDPPKMMRIIRWGISVYKYMGVLHFRCRLRIRP